MRISAEFKDGKTTIKFDAENDYERALLGVMSDPKKRWQSYSSAVDLAYGRHHMELIEVVERVER